MGEERLRPLRSGEKPLAQPVCARAFDTEESPTKPALQVSGNFAYCLLSTDPNTAAAASSQVSNATHIIHAPKCICRGRSVIPGGLKTAHLAPQPDAALLGKALT